MFVVGHQVESCIQKLLDEHTDVSFEKGRWKKVKEKRAITVHLSHEEVRARVCAVYGSSVSQLRLCLLSMVARRETPSRPAKRADSSPAARSCSSASSNRSTTILVRCSHSLAPALARSSRARLDGSFSNARCCRCCACGRSRLQRSTRCTRAGVW
jgi:hypothetical protein